MSSARITRLHLLCGFRIFVLSSIGIPMLAQLKHTQTQAMDCPLPGGSSSNSVPVTNSDFIELQRTLCYGPCPVYTVRIYGDGTVHWHGERSVQLAGEADSNVDATQAKALMQGAESQGFWLLCAGYSVNFTDSAGVHHMTTDLPTVFTTLTIASQSRKVLDYGDAAPQWLLDLDLKIDTLADTHRWRHGDPAEETFDLSHLPEDTYMPKPGVTPLMKAAVEQTSETLESLLKAGAGINAEDSSGWTAIMYAAKAGKLENFTLLLTAGAEPNHRSKVGETALFSAVSAWFDPVNKIKLLTAAGTDINAQDKHGTSALMIAAQHFWMPDVISTMIDLGANRNLRNAKGQTAADILDLQEKATPDNSYGSVRSLLALP